MWKGCSIILCFFLYLVAVADGFSQNSLPLPGIGRCLGSLSRQAPKEVAGYHDSDDHACRLPLAPGFEIRQRSVKGGPFYDAVANRIIQRPAQQFEDFCRGTKRIAVLKKLQAGAFVCESGSAESALYQLASDYLREEVLEDGEFSPAVKYEVSDFNGIARVRTIIRNEYGITKELNYYVESLEQEASPVLVLAVKERQPDVSTTYHGFVARCFGDTLVAGYARFLLREDATEAESQAVIGALAGIQVRQVAANPQLAKAVIGAWEASRAVGLESYADARYVFAPDGQFCRTLYVQGNVPGRGPTEKGNYQVFGNLISLSYDKGERQSLPVRVEGNVLSIGNRTYGRVR